MATIIGIKLTNRLELSSEFQNIITKFGCAIKTRIGLHSTCSNVCANWGTILLEVIDESKVSEIKRDLSRLEGARVQSMSL